ncbi:MAG: carboxymuconolactone decarboxylase family protein [Rhodospirillaceae bacterium]|jgi:uncharacterized peroxidase-related enzyme|nr:carboxymuconolactone decarboxylase family protein [Rhodospirillaceae bacterium]MBT4042099.1 carboxymuconolactone decarboxylase family protein [Rhodospirillaceae bacterium]MBT4689583.1 carboxymuconolactone decarboxylase family protein [Rhodospirillaceae bacterium]MBT5084068.1 carboxymuconolactone decarboxylase family protein [Rhodospirillaceae bacterium]MBT5525117.1 carboxymuconolactone decarboxylase family protein [Rhodospirillaceae bacterium]
MAHVRDIEIDEVPEDVRPIYQRYTTEYGPFLNQVRVFAHRPPAVRHIMGLLLDLKDEAVLDKRYLEIALVVVSKLNECDYCVTHHEPRLMALGLSAEAAADILADDVPGFDEVDMVVRDYSVQVTENPGRIRDAMHTRLRKHFSEEQIVELTLRIALCGFFNRFNDALGIENEHGVKDELNARIAAAGD